MDEAGALLKFATSIQYSCTVRALSLLLNHQNHRTLLVLSPVPIDLYALEVDTEMRVTKLTVRGLKMKAFRKETAKEKADRS